ncbi:hypothetical protein U9M48_021515 [Paspalum notatum var. saurae]|uniref:Uncharacterized protein n=1 Tax=Paspalum notatum var. saurae TaxID=547442 RepID=A0AAQ3THP1_PASNO
MSRYSKANDGAEQQQLVCHGVFHVASPVSNDPVSPLHMDPNRSPDAVLDETCWSDYQFCKKTDVRDTVRHSQHTCALSDHLTRFGHLQNLYCCAKMMAEITATEEAAARGLELAVVVPCMTMGPMLHQPRSLSSNQNVAHYLMGTKKTYPNAVAAYVDVRDVARAGGTSASAPRAAHRHAQGALPAVPRHGKV